MIKPPLLDHSQCDRALRDLMPVMEWLTNWDSARYEGAEQISRESLEEACKAFCEIPEDSPAVKAYIRWLEQNTEEDG